MKTFAIIIDTYCGPSIGVDTDDQGIESPSLHPSKYNAKQEIIQAKEEGMDVDDWSVEEVVHNGDQITIVRTGEKFNWKEGR